MHWDCRITLPGGSRSNPICLPGYSEARAREKARALTELAKREALPSAGTPKGSAPKGGAPSTSGETFAKWSERWCDERAVRGLASVETDRARLRKWIWPALGTKPIATIARADVEGLVEDLDRSVRARLLSWKTAINVFGLVAKAFKDAQGSKTKALRVRDDNPAAGVAGPDRGITKAKAYLYPTEFAALVSCTATPLQSRRAIALAVCTFTRASELRALQWEDLDLDRGHVHVHWSLDREGGDAKPTKTKTPRRFALEPAILPLLRTMHAESGGRGRVVELPDDRHLARALRAMLRTAGVDRADLHAGDATRKNMTWHDLRATGITWMAIRGDDPVKIMRRAGHEDFKTTQGYIREAEAVRDGFGDVFPPLPPSLVSSVESSEAPRNARQRRGTMGENVVEAPGIEPLARAAADR